jgi:hypothetical protein
MSPISVGGDQLFSRIIARLLGLLDAAKQTYYGELLLEVVTLAHVKRIKRCWQLIQLHCYSPMEVDQDVGAVAVDLLEGELGIPSPKIEGSA